MSDLYTLEWSKKQGFFHIQKLQYTLSTNQQAFAENRTLNDYHLLGVGTSAEMSAMADKLRNELYARG